MVSPLIVCHQLRVPENLASIARVMANFGFTDLILSDPKTQEFLAANRMAVRAEAILESFKAVPTLDEALEGVVYAVGSTSRDQLRHFDPLTPEEAVDRLAKHAARGKVALVLGGEKRGLSDDDLARCHDVLVIPTGEAQPSMNLSHAAGVLLYLCARHGQALPSTPIEPGASMALVQKIEAVMQRALLDADYLNPQAPEHQMGVLMRSLVRNGLTEREAHAWRSAFEQVERELTKRKGS